MTVSCPTKWVSYNSPILPKGGTSTTFGLVKKLFFFSLVVVETKVWKPQIGKMGRTTLIWSLDVEFTSDHLKVTGSDLLPDLYDA